MQEADYKKRLIKLFFSQPHKICICHLLFFAGTFCFGGVFAEEVLPVFIISFLFVFYIEDRIKKANVHFLNLFNSNC